jgi:hypothetical protein
LTKSSIDRINFEESNFNTGLTRTTALFVVIALQLFFVWDFFSYQFKKRTDKSAAKKSAAIAKKQLSKKVASSRETSDVDVNEEQQSDVSPPPSPQASPNGKVKAN